MSLAAQPAAIQAHSCAAQITAACRIAGVAVDAVDGDTCIKLTAFVVLHFVYTALKACVILTETTVIITVSTQLTAIVADPDAAPLEKLVYILAVITAELVLRVFIQTVKMPSAALTQLQQLQQQADITADTRQPAFIVHTSPQFSRILVF